MNAPAADGLIADVSTWSWRQVVGLTLSIAIAAINLFVGYVADNLAILAVGCSFLLGVVIFCTRFWDPVLYLVGVLHVAILGVLWFLSGMEYFTWGIITGVFSLALAAIALSLFIDDQRSSGEYSTADDTRR